MRSITEYLAPESVGEAVAVLGERGGRACVLAGGTDVMVRIRRGLMPAACTALVSLHRIPDLRGSRRDGAEIVLGAATTASALRRDRLLAEVAPILGRVADRLASEQVRNVATVGGNLVNASPAGDLIIPLLLLDARLVLASTGGTRTLPVEAFFTGPGESVLQEDELLTEIRFDPPAPERRFGFRKAGTRPAMECSVVTVGLAVTPRDGRLDEPRVAFGASAPTPLRGLRAEAVLAGQPPTAEVVKSAVRAAEEEVSPIDDVRGGARYRRALTGVYLRRLLEECN